jgi:hypothetical protein
MDAMTQQIKAMEKALNEQKQTTQKLQKILKHLTEKEVKHTEVINLFPSEHKLTSILCREKEKIKITLCPRPKISQMGNRATFERLWRNPFGIQNQCYRSYPRHSQSPLLEAIYR